MTSKGEIIRGLTHARMLSNRWWVRDRRGSLSLRVGRHGHKQL